MERNVGYSDKLVRIIFGAVSGLLSIAILANLLPESLNLPVIVSPILGVIALVLLATAFTEKCALYSALGIETN